MPSQFPSVFINLHIVFALSVLPFLLLFQTMAGCKIHLRKTLNLRKNSLSFSLEVVDTIFDLR